MSLILVFYFLINKKLFNYFHEKQTTSVTRQGSIHRNTHHGLSLKVDFPPVESTDCPTATLFTF
jgi:hypothetical protein